VPEAPRRPQRPPRPTGPGLAVAALLLALATPAGGDDVLTAAGCDSCHRLTPPDAAGRSLAAWHARRGPDLFYAGSKYRGEWLRAWLQAPERIRPAGIDPARHTRTVDGEDRLDPSGLAPHPTVPAGDVDAVVEALLERDWGRERLPEEVSTTPVPRPLAELNFVKFKGCVSCHRTSEDFGGVSGPELYTAWTRLRPEFLWSYVEDPQAWDPVAPMPGYELPPTEVGKLLEYLRLLSEERRDDD